MAYKFQCRQCRRQYVSNDRYASCSHCSASYSSSNFLADVAGLAVDVAVAYVAADIVSDVAGAVLGSIFDW